jgi:hypothetical protein
MAAKRCASTVADGGTGATLGWQHADHPVRGSSSSPLGAGPFRDAVSCAPSKALGRWDCSRTVCRYLKANGNAILMMRKRDASHVRWRVRVPVSSVKSHQFRTRTSIGTGGQERHAPMGQQALTGPGLNHNVGSGVGWTKGHELMRCKTWTRPRSEPRGSQPELEISMWLGR